MGRKGSISAQEMLGAMKAEEDIAVALDEDGTYLGNPDNLKGLDAGDLALVREGRDAQEVIDRILRIVREKPHLEFLLPGCKEPSDYCKELWARVGHTWDSDLHMFTQ